MALTKQQKKERVQEVSQQVTDAMAVVFVAFDGVTLADMTTLRERLYEAGCSMRVVPKRLLKLALQDAKVEFDPTATEGQIAAVWGNDAVSPAKVLHEFVKKQEEKMRLISGLLEGSLLSFDQVMTLSQLPSRQQLLGQLASVLAGPMRGFAQVLAGPTRATVYVLQAIKDKKS